MGAKFDGNSGSLLTNQQPRPKMVIELHQTNGNNVLLTDGESWIESDQPADLTDWA